jgi:hypothetical protein
VVRLSGPWASTASPRCIPACSGRRSPYFTDFGTRPGYLGFGDLPEQVLTGPTPAQDDRRRGSFTGADAARLHLNTDASSELNRGGVDSAFLPPAEAKRVVAVRLATTPPAVDFLGGI